MKIVGIDPGTKGYAVALCTVSKKAKALPLPFNEDGTISMEFPRWVLEFCGDQEAMVILEKLNVTGGDLFSKHTCFKMGFAYGQLDAVIRATLLPSRVVTPQQWQKVVCEGIDAKMKAKEKSLAMYKRLFPDDPIPKTPRQKKINDNAVDALFIAQYGALKYGGGALVFPDFQMQ